MAFLPTFRPERTMSSLSTLLNDFFNDPFFSMSNRDISGRMWPSMDIVEEKDEFLIRADIPGVDKNNIDISISGDVLTISGDKKEESKKEEEGGYYSHLERAYGSFSRSFTLPDYVDKESINATFKNGVLELSLKKTSRPQPQAKKIEVKG
ncbi:MAG: Hsp20 family protein [Chitinivibrionales bacterium]|nr:Hsp20 family protein [Chitinivibrionales bacterium]